MAKSNPFRWYYHSDKVNETKDAFQAAIENRCGMVVFVGKPGCGVCSGIWGSSNLDGAGKMAKFLSNNKLVGLKVDDTASHYMQLSAGTGGYKNPDGSSTFTSAPFIIFIKVKDDHVDTTSIVFSGAKSDIDVFFCGSNSTSVPTINYANVSKWLNAAIKTDAYKNAFKTASSLEDFRWYFHSKTKNETSDALTAALRNSCGLLVFVGKPGCHICETVWSSSYQGTEMMDGDGKMAAYLKNNKLVGLKIEDSQGHFSDLASGTMGYRNSDGTATNTNAPFLVLVKVKAGKESDTNFDLTSRKSDIEVFFGGYGSLGMYDKTYAKITAWLNSLLSSSKYKNAFQGGTSSSSSSSSSSKSSSSSSSSSSKSSSSSSSSASKDVYRWYLHSASKNETAKAVQAALDNNCGLLVVVGKPNCSTCEKAWGKSYMDGDGKLLQYLKSHRIVGLKIDDSQSHVQSIGSGVGGYTNYDKSKMDRNVPFLFLVKPKAGVTTFETLKKKTSIDEFFGGFGSKTLSGQTYKAVSEWLDEMLDPKLVYWDNRQNYSAVYSSGESPSAKTATFHATATLRCTLSRDIETVSAEEARKKLVSELNGTAISIYVPDWDAVKTTVEIEDVKES